jgi:hypothetical protein
MTRFAATAVLVAILAALAFTSTAGAICPRSPGRHGCVRPTVAYTYRQPGHDQQGNRYWRICHVPLHHRRWCGPWHRSST